MPSIERFNQWYASSEDETRDWREQAIEDINFYQLEHWTTEQIEQLKLEGRPTLVIPKIMPIINFLSGYQRQNRHDVIAKNRKGSTKPEADILTELIKQIFDLSNADYEISDWFLQGILTGRSWITGVLDYKHDPINGDLRLESLDPLSVFPDPNSVKYDYSDADYIMRTFWVNYEKVAALFPGKEKDLGSIDFQESDIKMHVVPRDAYSSASSKAERQALTRSGQVKIKECWYLERRKYVKLMDTANPSDLQEVQDVPRAIKGFLSRNDAYTVIESSRTERDVLSRSLICGDVVLEDFPNPLGKVNELPYIQFITSRVRGKILSVVTPLKDLQREINKRRSQLVHILNTLAKSGWIVAKGSTDIGVLKREGAKNGFVLEWDPASGGTKPEQIVPSPPSHGHILTENMAEDDMKKVSGANTDLLGQATQRGEPGVVLTLRQRQGQVVLEPLFDNFRISEQLLGGMLTTIITKSKLYSLEEIINILDIPLPEDVETVAEQERVYKKIVRVARLFEKPDQKRFNIKTAVRPDSPTKRMTDFAELMEIASLYPGYIPPEILLDASDISHKEEMLDKLKEMAAAGVAAPPPTAARPQRKLPQASPMPLNR